MPNPQNPAIGDTIYSLMLMYFGAERGLQKLRSMGELVYHGLVGQIVDKGLVQAKNN